MLSAQDIHDKQFRLVRQATGYDIDEVDAFLDEVEAGVAELTAALEAARGGASAPSAGGDEAGPSAGAAAGPTSAARILELAQQAADQYLSEARRSADALVGEAEQAARAAVAELESQRGELEARVAALRDAEAQIRGRLTGYLEGQLRDLRSLGSTPGSAPSA